MLLQSNKIPFAVLKHAFGRTNKAVFTLKITVFQLVFS